MMRVGLEDRIAHVFTLDEMLPAVGQGVVAVECAQGDWESRSRLAAIDHEETRACAEAERELLWVLDGHCNSPIAGHGELNGDQIKLRGAVISEDGAEIIETSAVGEAKYPARAWSSGWTGAFADGRGTLDHCVANRRIAKTYSPFGPFQRLMKSQSIPSKSSTRPTE